MRPPFSINWSIAERTLAFRKIVTINLAEPSGSSAAEKPPAKKRILALSILSTIVSTECSILFPSKVTNGTRFTWAPACSNALAESYSELVPGKTGMYTSGTSTFFLALRIVVFAMAGTSSIEVFCLNSVG